MGWGSPEPPLFSMRTRDRRGEPMTDTFPILTETTETQEVVDRTQCSEAVAAFRQGERVARKYRAQGHDCRCVGVLQHESQLELRVPTGYRFNQADGLTFEECRTKYIPCTVFSPVIEP